ncbi:hypothetical protein CERZMDRAFT_83757 [Cercospora zeae-maydis SCOH1-5]|uniref:Uncharacterized protein n=1 Tax=Cercospora zeae-maydis SCOH1-5 TaxID=717836 RepID=A0A6A6FJH4_9PEZI|nr:hypothetical protein CERZMDRAFT_83757 [Cercospora zeae-maydis SCOH1-5]
MGKNAQGGHKRQRGGRGGGSAAAIVCEWARARFLHLFVAMVTALIYASRLPAAHAIWEESNPANYGWHDHVPGEGPIPFLNVPPCWALGGGRGRGRGGGGGGAGGSCAPTPPPERPLKSNVREGTMACVVGYRDSKRIKVFPSAR